MLELTYQEACDMFGFIDHVVGQVLNWVEAAEEVVHIVTITEFFIVRVWDRLNEHRELIRLRKDTRKIFQPQVCHMLELLYIEGGS